MRDESILKEITLLWILTKYMCNFLLELSRKFNCHFVYGSDGLLSQRQLYQHLQITHR